MSLKKPSLAQVKDPNDLLSLLVDYYDQLVELDGKRSPSKLPGLKAITAATIAGLRMAPGDDSGEAGPRVALLSGGAAVLDGLQGAFAWNSTSTAMDDSSSVINPNGSKPGRWQRIVWSGVNLSLALFTSIASGIVPASGGGTANFLRADGSWAAPPVPATGGRLLAARWLSGASTAVTAGTASALAWIWGGGGGGGGAATAFTCYGAGGAAGGFALHLATSIPAGNWTHSIGAAGTAGNNSGSNGGAGGNTTFTDGSVTVTARGGPGGLGDTTGSASIVGAAAPAVSTNASLINGSGSPGGYAILGSWTGFGGSSAIGGGGRSVTSSSGTFSTGQAGTGFAAGGSGGAGVAANGAAGGAGTVGGIFLMEFSA